MAINFPNSPTLNQVSQVGTNYYIWNGTAWVGYTTSFEVNYQIDAILVQSDNSTIGTTTTLNFDNTFDVDYNSGITTVTVIGGGGGGGGESYWDKTTVGIHTLSSVGVGTTNPQTPLQVENVYGIDTKAGSISLSTGVPYIADSWTISSTDFKTAEYTLWFQHSSGIQSQKVLIMNNGTTAYYQEYGIMYSNIPIISASANISSGQVRLSWTPESGITGIVTYRFTRETML
jgi:hypothetical protein